MIFVFGRCYLIGGLCTRRPKPVGYSTHWTHDWGSPRGPEVLQATTMACLSALSLDHPFSVRDHYLAALTPGCRVIFQQQVTGLALPCQVNGSDEDQAILLPVFPIARNCSATVLETHLLFTPLC